MGVNRMTGSPWQVERVHRAEGDSRRSKKKCKYFNNGECSCEKIRSFTCFGSAHCMSYREKDEIVSNLIRNSNKQVNAIQNKTVIIPKKEVKQKEIILEVKTSKQLFKEIVRKINEQGFYHFRGFVENTTGTKSFESRKIYTIYLYDGDIPMIVRRSSGSFELVESGEYMTVAFKINGLSKTTSYKPENYQSIRVGTDSFYGKVLVKEKVK